LGFFVLESSWGFVFQTWATLKDKGR